MNDNEPQSEIPFYDLQMSSGGRVRLPKQRCEQYGVDEGDTYDIAVWADRQGVEGAVQLTDVEIGSQRRFVIPSNTRERYGIEVGDFIDIVLFPVEE